MATALALIWPVAAGAQELGQWTELGLMPISNAEFQCDELDGLVYCAGGFNEEDAFLVYDPAEDAWSRGPSLPLGNHHPGVVAAGGKLYVIGGHETESLVQVFDPATDQWSQAASRVPTPRRALAVVEIDGKIHTLGGTDGPTGGGGLAAHELYDPATDSWTTLAPLPEAREHGYAGVIRGRIYFAAGRVGNFEPQSDLQIYDPKTDSWSLGAPLPEETSGHAVQVVNGQLFAFGGERVFAAEVLNVTQRYDPARDRWDLLANTPRPLHGLGSAVFGGSVYLMGGATVVEAGSQGNPFVFRFDPPAPIELEAPRKLKSKLLASGKLRLKWKFRRQDSDATVIEVQVKTGRGAFEQVATVAAGVRRVVLDGLAPGKKHTFRVRANGPSGPSRWSNKTSVRLPS